MDSTLFQLPKSQSPADSALPSGGTPPRKNGRANLTNLSPEQRKKWRTAQLAEAKRRERARKGAIGDRTITLELTAAEMVLLDRLREKQRGPVEGFFRRALLLGATFAANAGNPRGRKVKGNVAAAAINPASVDASSQVICGEAGEGRKDEAAREAARP